MLGKRHTVKFIPFQSGFTLIEVLVAVTIVAVLATVGVVSYGSINKRARDAKRKSDIEQIRSALEMYRADNGAYPTVNSSGTFDTAANLSSLLVPAYMPQIPSDPKNSGGTGPVYYFKVKNKSTDPLSSSYYGYCICASMEGGGAANSCEVADEITNCNYYVKNP